MKKSNGDIRNLTHNLLACNAVPCPNVPPSVKSKVKATPWTGPEGSRRLKPPDFMTIVT
jgi:hypothetical protein